MARPAPRKIAASRLTRHVSELGANTPCEPFGLRETKPSRRSTSSFRSGPKDGEHMAGAPGFNPRTGRDQRIPLSTPSVIAIVPAVTTNCWALLLQDVLDP